MREEAASSVVLSSLFDHTVLDIMFACDFTPTSKLSHINKDIESPRGKSRETRLLRDRLSFFLNSSPLSLSFLPSSFIPVFPSSPALQLSWGGIYRGFCLLGSAITDPLSKEHHSPPAISAYSLPGRARRNSAWRGLKAAE